MAEKHKRLRLHCPYCYKMVSYTQDLYLRKHKAKADLFGSHYVMVPCPGSGLHITNDEVVSANMKEQR